MLWRLLKEMTTQDIQQFLIYVSGTDRVPLGIKYITYVLKHLLIIDGLTLKVQLLTTPAGQDDLFLPEAAVCDNSIRVPNYSSDSVLREKLHYAMYQAMSYEKA